jgi:hypothetical protein
MDGIRSVTVACALGLLLALISIVPSDMMAQQAAPATKPNPPAPAKPAPKPATPAPAAVTEPQPPPQVSIEQVLYLIRSTLLTLNDANRSGNYSVLRDLAAPDFQAKNTAADLAQAFADLRGRKFDLFGAALLAPQLTAAPTIDAGGKLRLSGVFPTRPLQIKFDLVFEVSGGQWKLLGIAIATPEAPPLQAQAQEPKPVPQQAPKPTAAAAAEAAKRPPGAAPR